MITYTKEELRKIAILHQSFFRSIRVWNQFAKKNKLPKSETYRKRFGSWKNAVTEILGEDQFKQKSYDIDTLKIIAMQHKDKFTTKDVWDKHAKEYSLPYSCTYRNAFGNWNDAKKSLGLKQSSVGGVRRFSRLSKEEMKKIAIRNIEYFTSKPEWNKFAKKHGYPSSSSYAKYFGDGSWNKAKLQLGIGEVSRRRYSEEELIKIALEYSEYFISQNVWDDEAKKKGLPWSSSYKVAFGTWAEAQRMIGLRIRQETKAS